MSDCRLRLVHQNLWNRSTSFASTPLHGTADAKVKVPKNLSLVFPHVRYGYRRFLCGPAEKEQGKKKKKITCSLSQTIDEGSRTECLRNNK